MQARKLTRKQVVYLWAIGYFKKGPKWASKELTASIAKSRQAKTASPSLEKKRDNNVIKGDSYDKAEQLEELLGLNRSQKLSVSVGGKTYEVGSHPLTGEAFLHSKNGPISPDMREWPKGDMIIVPQKPGETKSTNRQLVPHRSFDTTEDAEAWARKELDNPFEDIHSIGGKYPLRYALDSYRGDGYESINDGLRDDDNFRHDETSRDKVAKIDEIFRDYTKPLKESVEVHRGVSDSFALTLTQQWENGELEIGSTLTDKGYLSTSLSRSVAEDFMPSGEGFTVAFRIVVPAGNKAIWMGNGRESELLLPRGSSMVITGGQNKTRRDHFGDDVNYLELTAELKEK